MMRKTVKKLLLGKGAYDIVRVIDSVYYCYKNKSIHEMERLTAYAVIGENELAAYKYLRHNGQEVE